MAKDVNKHSIKEYIYIRCLTSLIIKEMNIKTTDMYYYSLIEMPKIKRLNMESVIKNVEDMKCKDKTIWEISLALLKI